MHGAAAVKEEGPRPPAQPSPRRCPGRSGGLAGGESLAPARTHRGAISAFAWRLVAHDADRWRGSARPCHRAQTPAGQQSRRWHSRPVLGHGPGRRGCRAVPRPDCPAGSGFSSGRCGSRPRGRATRRAEPRPVAGKGRDAMGPGPDRAAARLVGQMPEQSAVGPAHPIGWRRVQRGCKLPYGSPRKLSLT